jgi:energy-coupling factor transport system substrate-specific component
MDKDAPSAFFGARFSLYPMTDRFVPVILDAIRDLPERGLDVETDDVSTFLGGHPDAVFDALEQTFARAAGSGAHVVMTIQLSRGCPGEEVCDPAAAGPLPAPPTSRSAPPANVRVAAQWALYPLGVPEYMDVIYREIKRTKEAGVFAGGRHFVSRLEGQLSAVLGAVHQSFDAAGSAAGHVVAHVTLSANSPSAPVEGSR